MHFIRKLVAVLAFASVCSTASAASLPSASTASLVIDPMVEVVNPGNTFILRVLGTGFDDVVYSGGFNLSFDANVLSLNSLIINTDLWDFSRELEEGELQSINATGSLTDMWINSFEHSPTGDFLVATLDFTAKVIDISPVTVTASGNYPFVNVAEESVVVNFDDATAIVSVTAVPEPGIVVTLLVGLGLLGFLRVRCQADLA